MKNHLHIPRWVATVTVLAALICGGIIAISFRNWSNHEVYGASAAAITVAKDGPAVSLGSFKNGFASVLEPALPAVVNIHSSKVVKQNNQGDMPFFNDPFFRQFFGNNGGQFGPSGPQREESLGSGVILASDGLIVTNNHVISGASDIKVTLSNKREYDAKLIGTDPKSDIAVLKIDATGLPVLPVGDSSKLKVGDVIFCIGEPFGLQGTATMGIVSATGRSGLGIENYEDFIQTDASINPGNSGGAMINLAGDLVGINTAIETGGGGGSVGIGFAIPINMARAVMNQILAHGKVIRGYLGVYISTVSPELAKQFNYSGNSGVLVNDVTAGTPGAKAGLKRGDIITAVNGEPVDTGNQLQLQISQSSPGTTVKLTVWRDGKTQEIPVILGTLPENAGQNNNNNNEQGQQGPGVMKGVQVENLTPSISNQLNLPSTTRGVVVDSVDPNSDAAAAGVQQGDVIQEVNHKPVSNVQEYQQALSAAGNQAVLLLINHQGITNYVVVQPQ
ncbi:MAG TPA: DegQ family serine endoprotease [Candidatus Dormibacteraeota bacterium]|nr:DegQ family serine endoprotease [Candidatus Dormibacteraeota bacterium]